MGAMFLDAEMIMEEVVHIPDEVPSASCISSCDIQVSSLISDFSLPVFSTVTTVTERP